MRHINFRRYFNSKRIETRQLIVASDKLTRVVNVISDVCGRSDYVITASPVANGCVYFVTFDCSNEKWAEIVNLINCNLRVRVIDFVDWYEIV